MHRQNFCAECGARLARKGWRARIGGRICDACERRLGKLRLLRPLFVVAIIAITAFVLGGYLRPKPPPFIVWRAANSPLSDLPVDLSDAGRSANRNPRSENAAAQIDENASTGQSSSAGLVDDVIYICGARTKKGTPCKRRVHAAGERCYQHKGMLAILPLEQLSVKR